MSKSLSTSERSLCVSREKGRINKDLWHCREKLRHCSAWRAFWCIPWSLVKAVGAVVWRPVKKMFFTVY